MELRFEEHKFSESYINSKDDKDDFVVIIGSITSYYKLDTEPPIIRIKIGGNNPDEFLKKMNNIDPKIIFLDGSSWIYPPIEKIKNKIM